MKHAEADVQPAAAVASGQGVLLEGADEPVDHRAVDAEWAEISVTVRPRGVDGEEASTRSPRSRVCDVSVAIGRV